VPPVPDKHTYGFYLAEVPFSQLDQLEQDERITRLESAETRDQLLDDQARAVTHVDVVQSGTGFSSPRNGAGVRIGIADDYLDRTHADFTNNPPFETYDVTTGTGTTNWSTNVGGPGFHGTHVSGTVVGSGTNSSGFYRGVAPGAQWAFYKIADSGGSIQVASEVKAINRSVAANCDIFSMSVGGYADKFLDGTDPMDQAVDAAAAAGLTVIIAAGNQAALDTHDSASVAPGASAPLGLTVNNTTVNASVTVYVYLLWSEDVPTGNITLACTNLTGGDSLVFGFSDISGRNTKRVLLVLTAAVGGSGNKTYYFQLQNNNSSIATPKVHCYALPLLTPSVTSKFTGPDPDYTVFSPALADGAIAVGAYVHRTNWISCGSFNISIGESLGQMASFSSRGPRIDGLQKPDVAAPGASTISALSSSASVDANRQVPNIGVSGCTYLAIEGTSMAAPHAAGIAALILQAQPGLSPADVRTLMTTTASKPAAEDNIWGWGLLNASNAVHFSEVNLPGVWVNYGFAGVEQGTFGKPFSSVTEAATHAPSAGPTIVPRIRINAVNAIESLSINKAVRLEPFGGNVRIAAP
jgi:subtilisin family serine protease